MNLMTLIFFRESFKHTSSANIEIFWKTVLRYIFCKLQKSHSPKLPKYYPETFYGFYFVFQLINILIFFYPNKEGIVEFVFAQLNVWVMKASVQDSQASEILTFMVELLELRLILQTGCKCKATQEVQGVFIFKTWLGLHC